MNCYCQGGPSARSCHKMCFDATNKQMFLLGRYLEPSVRTAETLRVSVIPTVSWMISVWFNVDNPLLYCSHAKHA